MDHGRLSLLFPHSSMEWDALMKALDENGDGTIEYKELFDAIWEDKREYSRGVGAKPTVTILPAWPCSRQIWLSQFAVDRRLTSVRKSSLVSTACPSTTHRFEGGPISPRGNKVGQWTVFCP